MRTSDTDASRFARRLPQVVAVLVGAMFLASGAWALVGARSFFDTVARFEPYNAHFIHDIGAFQLGLGAVLILGALLRDALLVVLWGVAVGAMAHLLSHVMDRELGGSPASDIPFSALVAVGLVAAAMVRAGRPGTAR